MIVDLRLGDCLELMKALPDQSVDAVITDPPYGIGENSRHAAGRNHLAPGRGYDDGNWDIKLERAYIDEVRRVSRLQVIWGGNYYADWLPPSPCWLVWDKDNGACDFADCELAWTSSPTAVRRFRWRWAGFLKERPEERFHLTQKPLALMEWIVNGYTKPGDTILDPFMGSGTTGVACVRLGRSFIGYEIEPRYYAIAQKRIAEAQRQLTMRLE